MLEYIKNGVCQWENTAGVYKNVQQQVNHLAGVFTQLAGEGAELMWPGTSANFL